mgnify:CR=1 FL=1
MLSFFIFYNLYGLDIVTYRVRYDVVIIALVIGVLQVLLTFLLGIYFGFGMNPHSFTPLILLLNSMFYLAPIILLESLRSILLSGSSRRRAMLCIAILSVVYSFMMVPYSELFELKKVTDILEFVSFTFIPLLAENIFASYLVLLSGALPSIIYFCVINAPTWLIPILPNLPDSTMGLISIIVPSLGYVLIDRSIPFYRLRMVGLVSERSYFKFRRRSDSNLVVLAIVFLFVIWSLLGLSGFNVSVIGSGSMRPTLDVGDVVFSVKCSPSLVRVGDIIQYWAPSGEMIVHRVVEIRKLGGYTVFITKGDANRDVDSYPVYPRQLVGKVLFYIPKIGWASIYAKYLISAFTSLSYLQYSVITAVAALAIYLVMVRRGLR